MGQYSDLFEDSKDPKSTFNLRFGVEANPDEEAKKAALAKRYNLPVGVISEFKPDYETKAKADDAQAVVEQSPKLRGWLGKDPMNAKLSHDDLQNLADQERTVGGFVRDALTMAVKSAISVPQAAVGLADIPTFGYAGKAVEAMGIDFKRSQDILSGREGDTLLSYSKAQQRANSELDRAEGFTESLGAMLSNPSTIVTSVGESIGLMGAGGAVGRGLLKFAPKLAPWLSAAIGEGVVGAGSAAEQIRGETDDGLLSLKQNFSAVMSGVGTAVFGAAGGKAAQKMGLADIDTLLVKGGMETLDAAKVKDGFIKAFVKAGVSEGVFEEMPQSIQEQMWQNFAQDRPIMEGVEKAAAIALVTGAATGGAVESAHRAVQRLTREEERATIAQNHAQILTDLQKTMEASKVMERSPETLQSYMQDLLEDTGADKVFIDSKKLVEAGLDLTALAQAVPSVASQLDQVEVGGDIVIPTSELLTNTIGTEFAQPLIDNARTDVNGYSRVEAEQFMAEKGDKINAQVEKALEEKIGDDAFQQSKQAVEDSLLQNLNEVAVHGKKANQNIAKLFSSFYAVTAAKLGVTPEKMAKEYPLKFSNQMQQDSSYDQSGQLITDTANFKNWFKDSKAVDASGAPIKLFHGTSQSFDTFSAERGGSNAGNKAGKNGFFFIDRPDIAERYATMKDGDANVMPVYLSLQNPARASFSNMMEADKFLASDYEGDGAIVEVTTPSGSKSTVYAVKDPNQIKSVFNNGEFSTTDNNILHQSFNQSAIPLQNTITEAGGQVKDTLQIDQLIDSKDIPVITLQDLVGKAIFPTIADRTAAAALYTGIDSSQLQVAVPLLGGPFFPLRQSNWEANVVWANRGKGVTSQKAAKLKEGANYMMVVMGDANMHQSNSTVAAAFMGTLEAWVRDGRITPENVEALGNLVRETGAAMESKDEKAEKVKEYLENFVGFDDAELMHAYMDGISFDARKRILEIMASKKALEIGAPPMARILEATREPSLSGHRWGDGVLLVEVDQENHQVDLGTEGTTPHPDFPVGIRGKVVGKLNAPLNWEVLWKDWQDQWTRDNMKSLEIMQSMKGIGTWNERLAKVKQYEESGAINEGTAKMLRDEIKGMLPTKKKKGTTPQQYDAKQIDPNDYLAGLSPRRAFELAKPVVNVTQDLVDRIGEIKQDNIDSSRQARLAADFAADNWSTSDNPVNKGGVSPQEFLDAIANSSAKTVLNEYTLDEVKKGIKSGSMKIFQLGADGQIFFATKKGDPHYKEDYGITDPAIDQITKDEVMLTAVINNEAGARGIGGPAVVLKALQEGVTVLDAFAVKSEAFPDGFLPSLYAAFGFEKVTEVPFDPQYYSTQKLADAVKFWKESTKGYDPEVHGYPPLVIMKWKGTDADRTAILERYLRSGITGLLQGRTDVSDGSTMRGLRDSALAQAGAGDAANQAGAAGDQGAGRGASVASRARLTVQGLAKLSDAELKNLGLTAQDRAAAQKALGEGSSYNQSSQVDKWIGSLPVVEDGGNDYNGGAAVFKAFHGTTHDDIEVFKKTGSSDGFLGQGPYFTTSSQDASDNYAGVGPDLTVRIEREKEQIADGFHEDDFSAEEILQDYFDANDIEIEITEDNLEDLKDEYGDKAIEFAATQRLKGKTDGLMMPVMVKLNNPADTTGKSADLAYEVEMDDNGDVVSESGTLLDFIEAVNSVADGYGFDASDYTSALLENGESVGMDEAFRLAQKYLSEAYDDNGDMLTAGAIFREIVEAAGYDGIIMDADMYFGSGRRGFGGVRVNSMSGVEQGTLHIIPFKSNLVKSVFNMNPTDDPNILKQEQRGQISFAQDITKQASIISAMSGADLSTFIHEGGHFFMEVQADLASKIAAKIARGEQVSAGEQSILDDFNKTMDWFGIKETPEMSRADVWAMMSTEEKRSYHEMFARGWEAYAFEGNAPSEELRSVFQTFRAWLLNVYKSLLKTMNGSKTEIGDALKVELTDEVRAVFDRMIASTEQIKEAEASRNMGPLFASFEDAKKAGITLPEYEAYHKQATAATQTAIDELQSRGLRDMQWLGNARSRKLKEMQKKHDLLRWQIKNEVSSEVMSQPVYQAWQFLTAKQSADGSEEFASGKLRTEDLRKMYGTGEDAIWRKLSERRMTSDERGSDVDVVAGMFGYDSGDALVKALAEAQPPEEVIANYTDMRMLQEHGDIATPAGLQSAVDAALHNDARIRFVASELKALNAAMSVRQKVEGRKFTEDVLVRAAKDVSKQTIMRLRVRDVRPAQYAAAAARAGRDAEKYRGDIPKALEAKRNQLINMHAAKEASKALEEINAALEYFKRVSKAGSIPASHHNQIVALLEKYDLHKSTSLESLDNRASFHAWVAGQLKQGMVPPNVEALLPKPLLMQYQAELMQRDDDGDLIYAEEEDQAKLLATYVDKLEVRHYKEVSVEEILGLRDTIKQIEHIGRRTKKVLTDRKNREFAAVITGMRQRIEDVAEKMGRKAGDTRSPNDKTGQSRLSWRGFFFSHVKAANLLHIMDGGHGGPMWEHLMSTANDAANNEVEDLARAHDHVQGLLKKLKGIGDITDKPRMFPSIGRSLNRQARIVMAMNMGNSSNMQRLLAGEGWTLQQIKPVLDTLTADEWNFVQSMWDYYETFRPRVGAMESELHGAEPEWIEARALEVETADGQKLKLRGGYAPVIFDPRASGKAASHAAEKDAKAMMQAARVASSVQKSFTKNRVEEVHNRPLMLSLDAMIGGIQDTIHYLHWQPWIIDANRMIKALDEPIRKYYGAEVVKQLREWAADNAAGVRPARDAAERKVAELARNVSYAGLAFNVISAVKQVTGYTQSIAVVGGKWMAKGAARTMANPKAAYYDAVEKSSFMRKRATTRMRDLAETKNTVQDQGKIRDFLDTSGYAMMLAMQTAVDVPTWWAGYERAIDAGVDEDMAVAQADQAVIDAQGSGLQKDLASVERAQGAIRLLTGFMSFMNTTMNVNYRVLKSDQSIGAKAVDLVLVNAIPTMLGVLISAALVPSGGEEEPEDLLKKYAVDQVSFVLGQMVGIREIGQLGAAFMGEPSGDYGGAVGLRMAADILKLAKQIGQGEMDDSLRKAIVNAAGDFFRLPSAQINRSWTGIEAAIDGETEGGQTLAAPVFGFKPQ